VDGIHDHASGLEAAALIESAYRNLHNLFDKHMPLLYAPRGRNALWCGRSVKPCVNHAATLKSTTSKHINIG
jgi:hypothetical protein